MKKSRLLFILLLAAALAVGLWALARMPAPQEANLTPDREIPENSYMKVRHRIRDLQGELLYEVAAERLDQYPDSQVLRLDLPRLHWLDPAYENSAASARHGEIREFQVVLNGDVELQLDPPDHSPALMHGESLTLDSGHERVYSDQVVVISQSHAVMRGIGLDYRLDGSGGQLERDVKVRQFPPDAQQPTQALLQKVLEEAFGAAHAQEPPEDTLDLSADRMEWDAQKEVSVYRGNVRAKQGEMTLLADQLTVISNEDRVQALHAEGNARWIQVLNSGKPLHASAGSILYQIRQRKATLKKNVDLRIGAHQFTGEEVIYLIDEERVETSTTRKSDERIRIRLKTDSD
ncbi:MAG: lipopolysaccharide transport periplasmic protein LptA [Gammaproteobacteria bacterium]|nr:lipopolysaccharide transport periplasmic protein LptA [Gammaproteobacteria bacterium]